MTIVNWKKPYNNGQKVNSLVFDSPLTEFSENFLGNNLFAKAYTSFIPAVNISEKENLYCIDLTVPGFKKEELKINLEKGKLIVLGEHKETTETAESTITKKEFNYGSFQRSFLLPETVNEETIKAKCENGILKISIEKNKHMTPEC